MFNSAARVKFHDLIHGKTMDCCDQEIGASQRIIYENQAGSLALGQELGQVIRQPINPIRTEMVRDVGHLDRRVRDQVHHCGDDLPEVLEQAVSCLDQGFACVIDFGCDDRADVFLLWHEGREKKPHLSWIALENCCLGYACPFGNVARGPESTTLKKHCACMFEKGFVVDNFLAAHGDTSFILFK
ncbi:MAG: hypothetical protein A2051_09225 [Desulfovibrionales bacterium GWA2_65_9]|nr:MAG: hypothetical protein A2051_09225 [Desulfovibrionales bacterium GWA2_65_9]